MRKVEGTVSSGLTGLPVLHAQVSVLNADTTPAQLYSDNGVTPLDQPVLTNGLGYWYFYIADGTYTRIVANPDGSNPITFPDEEMYEDARNVSVPVGEASIVLPSAGARAGNALGFDGSGAPIPVSLSVTAFYVSASRQSISFDASGSPTPPTQTTIFSAHKQNTTETVNWTLTDYAGAPLTPVTDYLSAATGESVTMTETQFQAARGATNGVIVTGTLAVTTTLTASANVAAIKDGAAGAAGAAGTTGSTIIGAGVPGDNVGSAGDTYYDTTNGKWYDQKTGSSWGAPSTLSRAADDGWTIYDFRYGGLPTGLAIVRAQTSTDAVYDDVAGRAYATFSANTPVYRSDKGLALFPSSRNYLLNSTVPATQTVTLAVGKYILWGNGTGTLTSAAGTAVGTGFGALVLTNRTYQTLNITTGGTVTITLTGGCNYFQLENNPLSLSHACPTPLIVTAGAAVTRDGDLAPITGSLLTFLNSGVGAIVFETMAVLPWAGATGTRFLATNNASGFYTTADQSVTYWNGVDSASANGIGTSHLSTDTVKSAVAWSGTSVSFGGGGRVPRAQATAFAHGDAITSAWIGASDSNTNVTNSMSGWLARLHTRASRPSDSDLYDYYTVLPQLTSSVNSNFSAATSLPKWKAALALMRAGVRDVTLLTYGTSHTAATNPATNAYATSYPAVLAGLLTAAGIPASSNSLCGNGGVSPSAGISSYDSNVTFSAGWTLWGSPPQDSLRAAAGGTIDRVCPGTTDTATIYYEVGAGFGTIDVSINGGASVQTINTAGATGFGKTIVSVTPGTNTFRLTVTGQAIVVLAIFSNSASRQVNVINGGHVGATAATLAGTAGSYPAMTFVALLAPDAMVLEAVTNDAAAVTAQATYTAAIQTIITTAKLSGDIIVMTDPPTLTTTISAALQNTYSALQTAVALQNNCPVIDLNGGMTGGYSVWNGAGFYNPSDAQGIHLSPPWGYGMTAARVNAMLTA